MILVKLVCVLTGYEDKLPQVILANSPQKESLIQRSNDALRVSDENIGWHLMSLDFVESLDKHDFYPSLIHPSTALHLFPLNLLIPFYILIY